MVEHLARVRHCPAGRPSPRSLSRAAAFSPSIEYCKAARRAVACLDDNSVGVGTLRMKQPSVLRGGGYLGEDP
jgi:hypothetical protein